MQAMLSTAPGGPETLEPTTLPDAPSAPYSPVSLRRCGNGVSGAVATVVADRSVTSPRAGDATTTSNNNTNNAPACTRTTMRLARAKAWATER